MNIPLVSIVIPTMNRKEEVIDCILSIKKIDYPNYEIIVVDDASTDHYPKEIKKIFPDIKLICNETNEGAANSRNKGGKLSAGEYIFFLDSDTKLDERVVTELVKGFSFFPSAGLVAPIIYYHDDPQRIWYAGATINLLTSKAFYRDIGKLDDGRFSQIEVLENGHVPTAFMIKREVFDSVKGFDPTFFMGFEESDFAKRIEKIGYKIIFSPKAKIWHKVPVLGKKYRNKLMEFLFYISYRNPKIAFHTSKNRIRYIKRHASSLNFIIFLGVFLPASIAIYLLKSVLSWQPQIAFNIVKGSIVGLKLALFDKAERV